MLRGRLNAELSQDKMLKMFQVGLKYHTVLRHSIESKEYKRLLC